MDVLDACSYRCYLAEATHLVCSTNCEFASSTFQVEALFACPSEALAILAVCLLTTLCTAAATALTVHIVFRLQHRETEEAFDHD